MDAQNGGRAGDIDPADQWVLNPRTGHYELRLDNPTGQPPAPRRGDGMSRGGAGRDMARGHVPRGRTEPPGRDTRTGPRTDLPGQRSRRAGKGPAGEPTASTGRRKRKPKKSAKKKALLWTGGVMAFVLVGVSTAAYAYYRHLNGNINTVKVAGASNKGFEQGKPINLLVIGTDARIGKGNKGYGDAGSVGHADTTILFHVSADRTNATALSIPRDLITDIPDCTTQNADGTSREIPGTSGTRFNTSLGQDGRDPGCTMKVTQAITGLKVDHFMMVDFNAVKELTTAVGGVEVCVAKDVNDPKSHLELSEGKHVIEGEQALAFVRTRHAFGNQSDLDRIKIQQQFLASLARKMTSSSTLTSVGKLTDLAEVATKSLTVDSGIGKLTQLTDLAKELAKVNPKNITFTTLPVLDNPAEVVHATVVVNDTLANPLFQLMQSDTSLTEVKKKKSAATSQQDDVLKGPTAPKAEVRVDVYNGGGPQGSAQQTLTWLQNSQGMRLATNKGNAPAEVMRTTLRYAPNQAAMARTLAGVMGLPATALKQETGNAEGQQAMTLTLGPDYTGAGVPITGAAKAPEGVQKAEADQQICAK